MYLLQTQRDYTEIADGSDTNFDAYPIVLVVVGVFLLILGTMGFVGAVCGNKVLGRILLFLVRCNTCMYIMYCLIFSSTFGI